MPLNKEQQAAVEHLSGPLLVLAGPGTGKTQLLSAKVAYILKNIDINAENILCLTFTEAGAENMRARFQSMIGKDALDVNVYTYHAFGSNVLDRYKSYAENFDRKLDAPIDETAQYKIIADIQKSLPAMDILREAETKEIISIIGNAKAARLDATDLKKIAEKNIEDSSAISFEVSPILLEMKKGAKFQAALENTYQPILEVLLQHISSQPIVKQVEPIANILAKDLKRIIDELSASEKPSVSSLTKWKSNNFELCTPDPKHPEIKSYRLKDHIANKKLYSLANIMHKYDEKLKAEGLYDFSDMIECAIKYLKEDSGFRMQLSEQFQYILLDEFQDTSASQFELIKLLTDYEKPVIMAVGDDDQAIYEFQGANASNLRDFQAYYNAEVINLCNNYRSTSEVLSLSRKIAEQINDSFAKNYNVDKTLRSMRDTWNNDISKPPRVVRHEFAGTVAEYYWIAQQIRSLVDHGEDPNEIAVIAPKHKNIIPLLPYLKAQNLDVTYEKRDNILNDAKISMLIKLAKFIFRLANREQPVENLLEILSFEFWEVSADVAIRAVEKQWGNNATILEYLAGDVQLEKIASLISSLVELSFSAPLELWLDHLIGTAELNNCKSPFLNYYRGTLNQAELLEFYENLSTLRQKVSVHAKNLQPNIADFAPKLSDFIATIQDYEIAQAEIMRVSVYRDSGKAVQVMTSHKSKGLEFKHVFLTSVDDLAWGKGKGNNNRFTLPKNLTHIRHTGITDDEQLRLFFVAITRAKDGLTMTSARRKDDGSDNHRLRYLAESSYEDEQQISPYLLEEAKNIKIHDDLTNAEKIETLRLNWVSAYQKLEPDVMEILRERMKSYRLSASDLTSFIDIIYAGPQKVYQSRVLKSPNEPANFSMCYGSLIHSVFEQITNQHIDEEKAMDLFRGEAHKAVLTDVEKRQLLEKGEHSLRIAMSKFMPILCRENAKAEVNFGPEHLVIDGVPVAGKIDHMEIDHTHKTIEVYDFKTGKFHDQKWRSQPSLYKYMLQLGFYKLLLNNSMNYRNYKVTRGHILFVTPDADEQVYDKVYEYNDEDELELKRLMQVVYKQLTSLDFVVDNELFVPANKSNTLPKLRNFIELLHSKTQLADRNIVSAQH